MKRLFLSLFGIFSLLVSAAQIPDSACDAPQYETFRQLSPEEYLALRLPPLEMLLDNARDNPQVSFYASNKLQEERELKTIRRSWLKYIKVNANYSYGMNNIYNENFADQNYVYVNTGRKQWWYNVGVSLSLPFDEIFNRRNRIKRQEEKINSIQFEVERWYDDLSVKIIDAYTSAIENLSILQSVTEAMITAKAQYSVTEADFLNGAIDAQTLSRQRNVLNVAIREYEKTRANLTNALLRLEILSHTKIISRE